MRYYGCRNARLKASLADHARYTLSYRISDNERQCRNRRPEKTRFRTTKKIVLFGVLLIVTACQPSVPPESAASDSNKVFDVILTGGTVVDGLGNPAFRGDVGIRGDRIIAISTDALNADDAAVTVDVAGLVISPGFIDNHAHIKTTIHEHPLAENFTRQGITTIIAGLHSGDQPWPLDEYASSLEVAPNVGFFAGHTWTRKQVLTLEEAIKKMTSMPADQYNQRDRGRIKEGAFADLVVFDPDTIQDEATYVDPHRYPTGIHHVMINGRFVIKSGALTGERPGVWIKGPARPERVTIPR